MCGLVGIYGLLSEKHHKIFNYLLRLDTVRGPHSTGVALAEYKDNNNLHMDKWVGSPFEKEREVGKPIWNATSMFKNTCVLLGHNRYATVGAINEKNAHPFLHGDWVGAHNGTLDDYSELEMTKDYDTDSECLIKNIDMTSLNKVYPKINGAWALTLYNQSKQTMKIIRNKERPLYYVHHDGIFYWASEDWMLEVALDAYKIEYDCIWPFKKDCPYDLHISKKGNVVINSHEALTSKPKPKEVVPWYYGGNNKPTNYNLSGDVEYVLCTPDEIVDGTLRGWAYDPYSYEAGRFKINLDNNPFITRDPDLLVYLNDLVVNPSLDNVFIGCIDKELSLTNDDYQLLLGRCTPVINWSHDMTDEITRVAKTTDAWMAALDIVGTLPSNYKDDMSDSTFFPARENKEVTRVETCDTCGNTVDALNCQLLGRTLMCDDCANNPEFVNQAMHMNTLM